MHTTPSLTRLVGATTAALALTFGFAACGDDGDNADDSPTAAAESSTAASEEGEGLAGFGGGRGEDVEGESLALPTGFPEEIPLLAGRITSATADEESGGWDVTIAVGCWDEIACRSSECPECLCDIMCTSPDAAKQAARAFRSEGYDEVGSAIDGETYSSIDGETYRPIVEGFANDAYHVDVVAFGLEDGTIRVAYVVRPAR